MKVSRVRLRVSALVDDKHCELIVEVPDAVFLRDERLGGGGREAASLIGHQVYRALKLESKPFRGLERVEPAEEFL